MYSIPTLSRTISGATPAATNSSSVSWEWVVVALWMASDLASPMLARWENSSRDSMNFEPASRPAFSPKARMPP